MRSMQGAHTRRSRSSWDRRSGRSTGRRVLLALVVLLVVVVAAAGALVGVQLSRPTPSATADIALDGTVTVPGSARLPLPAGGSTVVAIPGEGTVASVNPNTPVPLASITKLVTALVVLAHHPLAAGEPGPTITVSAAVASQYRRQAALHYSVIPVQAGEHLTERQALEAMLVPSADNVAQLLATWISGSQTAFVAAMNAEAARLGLHHTHFADPAGLSAGSAGSAADAVRLGTIVMAQPVLRSIVAMPQVTLPLAGTVYNYDYDLGRDGIIGIKTGSTLDAGGDFLFAARRQVGGRSVVVIGAVLGRTGSQPLQQALDDAERLAVAAPRFLRRVTVLPAGRLVVRFRAPWGGSAAAVTTRAVTVWARPGQAVPLHVALTGAGARRLHRLRAGTTVATVTVDLPSGPVTVPAVSTGGFAGPTLRWRLTRS